MTLEQKLRDTPDWSDEVCEAVCSIVEAAEWCGAEDARNDQARLQRRVVDLRVALAALSQALEPGK